MKCRQISVSPLGPGSCETHLGSVSFSPSFFARHGALALHPILPEPDEVVPAMDVLGNKVTGVFRLRFGQYVEKVTALGFRLNFGMSVWINSRNGTCHIDVDYSVDTAAWNALLAHANRRPKRSLQPSADDVQGKTKRSSAPDSCAHHQADRSLRRRVESLL
eukprot:TRINITY_DN40849_c0_g1_i1.p1 TRINITY_DN40849_c0_g1~~TRINITY_DN40849_c0_g1_i1.p1  ORF type:complete len:162 (-),score=20.04 TRINITY_DN40849_c0_g1_i1:888-1373(-)